MVVETVKRRVHHVCRVCSCGRTATDKQGLCQINERRYRSQVPKQTPQIHTSHRPKACEKRRAIIACTSRVKCRPSRQIPRPTTSFALSTNPCAPGLSRISERTLLEENTSIVACVLLDTKLAAQVASALFHSSMRHAISVVAPAAEWPSIMRTGAFCHSTGT